MLVLDANILVRAVLGRRVRQLLITYAPQCPFLVPDPTLAEVRKHLPAILERRAIPPPRPSRCLTISAPCSK